MNHRGVLIGKPICRSVPIAHSMKYGVYQLVSQPVAHSMICRSVPIGKPTSGLLYESYGCADW